MNSYADSLDLFLIAMGYTSAILYIMSFMFACHAFFCYLFVHVGGMGLVGAANAHNLTSLLTCILTTGYISRLEPVKEAWYMPTRQTFQNLWPFLRLALPGMMMLSLENANMQISVLLASFLGDIDKLAAQTTVVAFGDFIIQVPYGLSLGAVTLVGNTLGANKPKLAIKNAKMVLVASQSIAVVVCTALFFGRHYIMGMYGGSLLV